MQNKEQAKPTEQNTVQQRGLKHNSTELVAGRATFQTYRWLTLSLITLIAFIILSTFNQYGMSWDEYYRFNSGDAKLRYYQKLLSGQETSTKVDHYPGLFDLTLATIHPYFPWSRITTGHLMSCLFGLAAIIGVAMTCSLFAGWQGAFWATLFIVTLPRFYGHICFNPKDIPFAATYIWGLFFLIKYIKELRTSKLKGPSWPTTIGLGITFGTCMSMRIGGLILFCYLVMALVIAAGIAAIGKKATLTSTKQILFKIVPQLIIVGSIASLLLLFWWPYAHGNFFSATSNTLGKITAWQASGGAWQLHVLFDGHYYKDADLPFYYWPWMFVITTPLFHLFLIILGIAKALTYFSSKLRSIQSIHTEMLPQFMIVFAAIFPVVFVVISGSNVFDGIRHLLFVLTPLAVCVGIMITQTLDNLPKKFTAPILFILMTLPVWSMVKLHPYQYTFYNFAVGGIETASNRYETDYWGTSNRAAVEALVDYFNENDPQFSDKEYLISVSNGSWLSSSYFPENFKITARPEVSDFYIGNTRMHGHEALDGKTIIEIKAGNTVVCIVKDRKKQKKAFIKKLIEAQHKNSPADLQK